MSGVCVSICICGWILGWVLLTTGDCLLGPGPPGSVGPLLGGGEPLGPRALARLTLHCGSLMTPLRGSTLLFSEWGLQLSLQGSSWDSRALGVSGCLGPGFPLNLLQVLGSRAAVSHTHYSTIRHLHGGSLWIQALTHSQVGALSAFSLPPFFPLLVLLLTFSPTNLFFVVLLFFLSNPHG